VKLLIKNICIFFIFLLFTTSTSSNEFFVSLKKNKVNVRYGPSFESEVKYIYKKINLPIKQIDKKENWRRIIDLKNNSGWIHLSQLKPVNSIIPLKDKILFKKPSSYAKPIALIKAGKLLIIKKCESNWCKVKTDKYSGWINKKNIWGKNK
tara:strand:- start:171 stop:623 length:453 start_codon:yes stop_codon:yes gene_type:complete